MTQEEFIKRAKEIHGERYGYSLVDYINSQSKVKIICSIHGEFSQIANNHLRGKGCSICGIKSRVEKQSLSFEDFKKRAIEIHKNKYEYSSDDYINSTSKAKIICKIHGVFFQQAISHLQGCGCPKCRGRKSREKQIRSLEKFITQAKEIHGYTYSYEKSIYLGSDENMIITCKLHGDFFQNPYNHIKRKRGCQACSGGIKKSKEYYIEKANIVHNFKYDYSKIGDCNSKEKVEIICSHHGSFFLNFDSHINRKRGCQNCQTVRNIKYTKEEFVALSNKKHNFKYNYDKSDYKGRDSNVVIECPQHGDFIQIASDHFFNGSGCPKCLNIVRNLQEFIDKANIVHDNRYDYSLFEYINSHTRGIIICKEHGNFTQNPNNHLFGQKCPECAKENNIGVYTEKTFKKFPEMKNKSAVLYFFRLSNEIETFLKVGITISTDKRITRLKTCGFAVSPIATKSSTLYEVFKTEQKILKTIKKEKYTPTVDFGGKTECIKDNSENIKQILNIMEEI